MNWLLVALPLLGFYLFWFGKLFFKRNYTRTLFWFALAHFPYMLVNMVAPFRGIFDPEYAGYTLGWVQLPKGIWVTLVVGAIVVGCFILATRALQNRMKGLWKFAFAFDVLLGIFIALPVLLDILGNLSDFRLELGEYLQISGVWVALLIFGILTLPTFYACYVAGKNAFRPVEPSLA